MCGKVSRKYDIREYPSTDETYGLWSGGKFNSKPEKDESYYDSLENIIDTFRGITIDNLRFEEKSKNYNDEEKTDEESFSKEQIYEFTKRKEKYQQESKDVDFIKKIIEDQSLVLVDTKVYPPSKVEYSDFKDFNINKNLADFLINVKGIKKPYAYQKEAFDEISSGKNVIITAPTASGKTESFMIPIINYFMENPNSNEVAFFVYPIKALAGDQYEKFFEYQEKFGINFAKLDGDVKDERIEMINKNPKIIITNMEFIHHQMINDSEFSEKFKNLLKHLKFLVIDEVHTQAGYPGSNSIELIKRIRRFSEKLQIIGASATIENPSGYCKKLFSLDEVVHIEGIGERGEIELFLLYPTPKSIEKTHGKKPTIQKLISNIFVQLVKNKVRTIAFSNSRMNGEEIFINSDIEKNPEGVKCGIHRAGLLKEEREQAEKKFKNREIDGIVSTPTLELGMDIGDVVAVITEFVPLPILEQRIGRAGRRKQNISYAFMILDEEDPISKYYSQYPEKYWEKMELHLDSTNESIIRIHKIFSAHEKPFTIEEVNADPVLSKLRDSRILVPQLHTPSKMKLTRNLDHSILSKYSLRDIGQNVEINLESGKHLGDWDLPMAYNRLHPSAIYLHNGKSYRVKNFDLSDLDNLKSIVFPESKENLRTTAIIDKEPIVLKNINEKESFGIKINLVHMVLAKRIRQYWEHSNDGKSINRKSINDFELGFPTVGIELDFSDTIKTLYQNEFIKSKRNAVFHSLEHVIIHCGNMMIGGVFSSFEGITKAHDYKIYIFDQSVNGGNGSSNVIFNLFEEIIKRAKEIVDNCECEFGCPYCIHTRGCESRNMGLNKKGLREMLTIFLDQSS